LIISGNRIKLTKDQLMNFNVGGEMAYTVMQLGEKEGFDKPVIFHSDLDEQSMQKAFDDFRKQCVGVAKDHLPIRCPVRKKGDHMNCFSMSAI
jgi:hypothetical protein